MALLSRANLKDWQRNNMKAPIKVRATCTSMRIREPLFHSFPSPMLPNPTPPPAPALPVLKFEPPYYPIVYVRGYAMTSDEREEVFHDGYYGFAATSVEKRQAPPPPNSLPGAVVSNRQVADIFEGQLIRFMKLGDYRYLDSVNEGLRAAEHPQRSIWVSRFYDEDFISGQVRSIEKHAEELADLILRDIPAQLRAATGNPHDPLTGYKVILIAHSMGGLVSRCLLQNILPKQYEKAPQEVVHRFVTMGTPHRGIDLGRVPDFLEQAIVQALNPFDSNIFQEKRMRQYLNLEQKAGEEYTYDVHSLGQSGFPIDKCLCIIGSDYSSYGVVRNVTGAYSDGLVRQDRAYVVAGPRPAPGQVYDERNQAFIANVHRAHSGYRGIVNSYESFENIQRFLFGDVKVDIALGALQVNTPAPAADVQVFYDFEFKLSVRGSNAYLHQRNQIPCENAIRRDRKDINPNMPLKMHTAFLNSRLARPDDPSLHFLLAFRVVEFRVKNGFFFDRSYPERTIYSESLELRVANANVPEVPTTVAYHWLSDADANWTSVPNTGTDTDAQAAYDFELRYSGSLAGKVMLRASAW
jgi:pimeloyl-ACP methyl ester carboxylesterase